MKKLKIPLYLALTLFFSYALSKVIVYGSGYASNLVNSFSSQGAAIQASDMKLLCVMVVIGFLSAFFKCLFSGKFSLSVICSLKQRAADSLLAARTDVYSETAAGALINKLNSDMNLIEQYLSTSLPSLLTSILIVFIAGVSFYRISRLLVFEVGACCIFILAVAFYTSKKLAGLAVERTKRTDRLLSIADDFLRGIIIGRSYQLYPVMEKKINSAADEVLEHEYRRTAISSYSWLLQTISEWLPMVCLVGVLFLQSAQNQLLPGDITYLVLMMNRIFKPFSELPALMNETSEVSVSFQRINGIIQCEKEEMEHSVFQDHLPRCECPVIEFNHAAFSYKNGSNRLPVLKDLSFQIRQGEEVAIVGPSGGGKSTIFKLLCRFAEPEAGDYRLFGLPFKQYSVCELRRQFAVVTQEPFLFQGSILENIRYGRKGASLEEIKEVCRLADVDKDIEARPEGYHTILNDGGKGLSGGEKQRISLARALLKNAPILLLDEPTAALDVSTEASIRHTLDQLKGQKTILMIAHRLSTVEKADRILVISGGSLIEEGTDGELMKKQGLYYHLKTAMEGVKK